MNKNKCRLSQSTSSQIAVGLSSAIKNSITEISIRSVVMHELGHSIGLSHSQEEDSVMYSFYQYDLPPRLSYDDILAVHTVYGTWICLFNNLLEIQIKGSG